MADNFTPRSSMSRSRARTRVVIPPLNPAIAAPGIPDAERSFPAALARLPVSVNACTSPGITASHSTKSGFAAWTPATTGVSIRSTTWSPIRSRTRAPRVISGEIVNGVLLSPCCARVASISPRISTTSVAVRSVGTPSIACGMAYMPSESNKRASERRGNTIFAVRPSSSMRVPVSGRVTANASAPVSMSTPESFAEYSAPPMRAEASKSETS